MSSAAQLRIPRLAANPAVHRAFHWLHLHQPQLRRWLMEAVAIPAPPFGEAARAAWFVERFQALGLEDAHIDAAGNVLAVLHGNDAAPIRGEGSPLVLISAHLDTVFPAGTCVEPKEDGERILAPGVCDNGAGLTGLLAIAAAMRHAELAPAAPILFAANVGEEGEGDLRGMRHLFSTSPFAGRIRAAIVLEGAGSSAVVTRALSSRRFRVTVTGPGGHAWADAGAPNPILALSRALLALEGIPQSTADPRHAHPRTTLNVGQVAGGSAINAIPESASAWIDLRSTDAEQLRAAEAAMRQSLEQWVLHAPTRAAMQPEAGTQAQLALAIEVIGDRPGGELSDDAPMLATLRAVDRHLHIRTEAGLGSTDANIPLSLGVPAIAIGTGGAGGGIHTLQEWYEPAGRETALRRILLTLLDATAVVVETEGAGLDAGELNLQPDSRV